MRAAVNPAEQASTLFEHLLALRYDLGLFS
jgi:hypothetical protein